jgi:prevent-host-death family protein
MILGGELMPKIRPISDLRNNANEISEFCRTAREPVFITKNGIGDMVVMSIEVYERQQALVELYAKLSEAEEELANGEEGEDFLVAAKRLREHVYGRV